MNLTKKKLAAADSKMVETARLNTIKRLRKIFKRKGHVYTINIGWDRRTGGAKSVMVLGIENKRVINVSGPVSDLLDIKWLDNGSLSTSWSNPVVRRLSDALYGDEYAINEGKL